MSSLQVPSQGAEEMSCAESSRALPDHEAAMDVDDAGQGSSSPSPQTAQTALVERPLSLYSIAGAFLFLFASYGMMQTMGTVQSYLELNQLSSSSAQSVGWITGIFTALALFLGIQIGPLFDAYGPRLLAPVGCVIYIPVFFVLAECQRYWHFILVLGIWGAVGAAILSMVGIGVIGKCAAHYRGLVMGMAICGSSVGGVVMPLMLRKLFPSVGWAYAMRAIALLQAAVIVGGAVCLRQAFPRHRQSASSSRRQRRRVILDFVALQSSPFVFVTMGNVALEFAVFGVISLLPTYANAAHLGSDMGFALVAIANATSTAGRLLPGLAGDHLGHFNVLLCMTFLTVIVTGVILVPFGSTSVAALYLFSALWGFGSGSFISLTPVCLGKVCEPEEYGKYYGTMYFFVSFALLLASPLGGKMLQTFGNQALAGLYVGVVGFGGICFLLARQLLCRSIGLVSKSKV